MKFGKKSGLSMAELVVAIAIIALSLGPLIGLLSSSNQMSNHSIYEEMSVHYCREITDQILRLSPNIPFIVKEAADLTKNSKLSFGDLLNDDKFNRILQDENYASDCVPFQYLGRETGYRIVISRMAGVFKGRQVKATELKTNGNTKLTNGRFWKIVVTISWKASKQDPVKDTETVIIVGDYL